jgi:(p)ppGpp synthase/HD superfamily hydrolase
VAGVLHDVIDDTRESLRKIEEEFGDDVAKLVAGVSKLSYINQVLLTGYDNKPISFGSK